MRNVFGIRLGAFLGSEMIFFLGWEIMVRCHRAARHTWRRVSRHYARHHVLIKAGLLVVCIGTVPAIVLTHQPPVDPGYGHRTAPDRPHDVPEPSSLAVLTAGVVFILRGRRS